MQDIEEQGDPSKGNEETGHRPRGPLAEHKGNQGRSQGHEQVEQRGWVFCGIQKGRYRKELATLFRPGGRVTISILNTK